MNWKSKLASLLLLITLASCSGPDEPNYLQTYEGSYGGEDYTTYSIALGTEEYVSEDRRNQLIEENKFFKDLSDADKAEINFPLAVLGFRCDSREKGAVEISYEYIQDDTLDDVRAGSYVPHDITVDGFKRTVPIEFGMFAHNAHKSRVLYIFWDLEDAKALTVETPLTPKTIHPIEKYRASLSKMIRLCRGFMDEQNSASSAPVDHLRTLVNFVRRSDPQPSAQHILYSKDTGGKDTGRDCSLAQLEAGIDSRACAIRKKLHNHIQTFPSTEDTSILPE